MKKYRFKHGGRVVCNKTTCRDMATNKIKYIDWSSDKFLELRYGATFNEEEKDFMLANNDDLEVIEVE